MKNYTAIQQRILAATSISYIVVILDTTIVNVALERISTALHTGISGLQWVMNAYMLTFASLLLTGGALGDRWGARNIYLAGLIIFTLASAFCGIALSLTALILARILQGVGAAMLVPCSLTLINNAFSDPGQRASAIGVWASLGGVAMAAGPLVGGILINLFGWRSIFLANLPIGLIGVWLTWRVAHDEKNMESRHLDLAGQITAIIALAALITVLIEGPTFGWQSSLILAGIFVSVLAGVTFLTIEAKQLQPMLPLSFFKNGIFSGAALVSMTSGLTFYGLIFVLSLYFQQVREYSPLWTGIAFLPLTAFVAVGSILSGRFVKVYGPRWPVLAGLGLYIIGFLSLLRTTQTSSFWLMALPMPAIGFGAGLISPAATAALMGTVEKNRTGIAAGVLNSVRQTGAALGVAIFGALIAATKSLENGLDITLWAAAVISFITTILWWFSFHTKINLLTQEIKYARK